MRRQRLLLFLSAIATVALWTYACGDGTTEPTPDPPRPTTVTVSPATAELAALGATVQLSAQVQDQNGQVMSGATVAWASSATAVATVSATGLVTAAGNGTATITATSGQASGSATVTVTQVVSSVTVAPAEANFAALGDTLRLTAEALDANGSAVTGVEFSWGTNDDAVATVDGSGLVTAMANGTATITATSGGASGTATVTVAQVVSSVTLAPAEANFAALGDTLRLTAQALDANGQAVTGAEFSWESNDDAVATVDGSGLVTAAANGTATITAMAGEASGSATVTVAQVVSSVTVAPAEANFTALGDTLRLTAEAFDANGSTVTGVEFSWESSATAVATVSATGLVTAVANGTATITATSGGASASATVTVAQEVSSVTVVPAEANFAALGDTLRLTAEAFDANGSTVTGAEFSWGTSDDAVATVDGSGLVTAAANGTATITATAGEASGSATVTVAQVVSSVAVAPAEANLAALGDTLRLTAQAFDANGHAVAGAEFSWESSDDAVATVDATGLVTATANGIATITATSGEASASATVTVAREVNSVTVVPAEANFAALGDTLRLTAQAFDANGHAVAGAEFSWQTSDDAVATVSATGLATAVANGTATITATAGQASASATVTVTQEVGSVTVTPAEASLAALGDTLRLTAQAFDANGHAIAGAEFSWQTSDDAVATVDATGLVTAIASGSVTITATSGPVSGSATVTVAQDVSSVTLVPDTAMVVEGDTLRIAATATDANGQAVTGAAFVWGSGDTTVAVVDTSGLVTGIGAGQVQVTATTAGVTGRAELTVVAPVPTTIAVTPDTVVLTALGHTAQLAADVRDQLGRMMDGVRVAWSSADTTVVVVDSTGLVTAVGGGVATITATAGDASGSALLTVVQSVDSLTVSPSADTIAPGDTLRLVAEAYDESGHVVAGAVFTWSSNDAPVATVDPSGLVRGAGEGTATITATAGDASGTSEVTVVNPDRAALVALYNATDGPNWVDNTNWLTDAPLGEWYGVTTNGAGRAVQINLSGQWDSETQRVVFHGLKGELPVELAELTELRWLHLSRNSLTGPIAPELGNLAELSWLDLSGNNLTGPIPSQLGNLAKLQSLSLSANDLTGRIPPELGSLAALWRLELDINYQLTGPIPPELGNLANLDWLILRNTNLTGPIPPELGNLSALTVLALTTNNLTGPIPPELGNLSALTSLGLGGNGLTGPIPPELGNLSALTSLGLSGNNLTGPIPRSFVQLDRLRWLFIGSQDVCVPGTSAFAVWFEGIASRETNEVFCNATDVRVLESLYRGTGGADWTASGGWLGNYGVEDWYGVTADPLGHVTELDLAGNRLTGRLPAALGDLPRMTVLRIADNGLSGRIPRSMTALPLVEFRYSETELCAPAETSFQSWLNGITSLEGTGVNCEPPSSDRDVLEILYHETGGPDWTNNGNWLTETPLRNWYGVDVDGEGRVSGLSLVVNHFVGNNLVGRIPPELGNLAALTVLDLAESHLTGPIPPELGNLTELTRLRLGDNNLTGPIPLELGKLSNLEHVDLAFNKLSSTVPPELGNAAALLRLFLGDNNLTGPIPPELGDLARLNRLDLQRNNLTGPIPPELGDLSRLIRLDLQGNSLTGQIPPELGNLAHHLAYLRLASNNLSDSVPSELGALTVLRELVLANNPDLAGALPQSLAGLDRLRELHAGGTGLCAPTDAAFQAWMDGVPRLWIAPCTAGEPPAAYLSQAVQSREFPVPLVAGERALLRVFPTARQATSEGIPLVRARFYVGEQETHVHDIPGKSDPIPTEVDEGSLSGSANAEIPAWVIQPGLEVVIEVDPDGTLDPGLGVARRIPETGRLAVRAKAMPTFDLTLIPFIWTATHDSSIVDLLGAMAADPEHHELLGDTRTLLPIGDLAVTAHQPVLSSSNNGFSLLSQTEAIRIIEGGTGHYMGMSFPPPSSSLLGVAYRFGRSSYAAPASWAIAHELGHNLSFGHAPCGTPFGLDPWYPYPDGATGAWGYDFRSGRLVSPEYRDLMAYCGPRWISDYHFSNALRYRLVDEETASASVSASTRSLLLWGGTGADSVPYLEPTFVVDAPAALPDSTGDYEVTGRTAADAELFSLSFTMPQTADGDGSSSFAFALPVRAEWENSLATITLSGPKGSVTLDGDTDIPMAILRDPRTGQVQAIVRDLPAATETAADAVGGRVQGLEVLFSRGIPGAAAWRR